MDRRSFLVKSGSAVVGVGVLSLSNGIHLGSSPKASGLGSSPKASIETASGLTSVSLQESYINNAEIRGLLAQRRRAI